MNLTTAVQESLVCLLLFDEEYAPAVRFLLRPEEFDPIFAEAAQAAVQYRDRWGEVPGEHALDLFDSLCARDEEREGQFRRLHDSVQATRTGLNRAYVLQQAEVFARYQRLKRAAAKLVRALKRGDEEGVQAAEGIIAEALQPTPGLERATSLADADRSLRFLREEHRPFSCGIPALDEFGHGPARKRLHVLIGLSGFGKSWWLVWLAREAVRRRLRVLYVTLELGEPEVLQRMVQALFAVRKRDRRVRRVRFDRTEGGAYLDHHSERVLRRPHLSQPGIEGLLRKRLARAHRTASRFLVREFTELSPLRLEAYLDTLEQTDGFIPDLVLVDYLALMEADQPYREERHRLGSIGRGLRVLAKRRNVAVATVQQSNRAGFDAPRLDLKHTAEDASIYQTADVLLTLSQSDFERELGLARLFVAKGRTDVSRYEVVISQAYDLGQFCADSVRSSREYRELTKEKRT